MARFVVMVALAFVGSSFLTSYLRATFIVIVILLFVLPSFWSTIYYVWAAPTLLDEWATQNRFRILDQGKHRLILRGPFTMVTSDCQRVFRIRVADEKGAEQEGWICCGSFWIGLMLKDKVQAIWDEKSLGSA